MDVTAIRQAPGCPRGWFGAVDPAPNSIPLPDFFDRDERLNLRSAPPWLKQMRRLPRRPGRPPGQSSPKDPLILYGE